MNETAPLIVLAKLRRVYSMETVETPALGGIDLAIESDGKLQLTA